MIIAGIPSLQRGAVWNAGQAELLWDSILRGFPVGALVLCPKLSNQGTHSGKHGSGWSDEDVSHHLLDGQQRCNAIALGFVDALKSLVVDGKRKSPPATLWIDLAPVMPKGSTRQFLLRVITTAHPWGYTAHDKPDFLGVAEIRKSVERYGSGKRPNVEASWPHVSGSPIPFAWLSDAAFCKGLDGRDLWASVLRQCREYAGREWADNAATLIEGYLDDGAINRNLNRIESSLIRAKDFMLVALEVPQTAIQEQSVQEENGETSGSDEENRIYNVEHLFQRLNSAGTELRGEELLFSMIKAYWPNIEKSFEAIEDKLGNRYLPMPGSRLAMLGARAALIDFGDTGGLPPSFTISKIRGLAVAKTETAITERKKLENYFGVTGDKDSVDFSNSDLHQNLRQIDTWLLFDDSVEDDIGLPPVLRSSLAQGAPEVFLLLLYFAQKVRNERLSSDEIAALRKPILGVATALYWFGEDFTKAIKNLLSHFATSKLSPNAFSGILRKCLQPRNGNREILTILSPSELDALIPVPSHSDDNLPKWTFWRRVIEIESDPEVRAAKEQNEWPFLWRVINSKAMLLFAQRLLLSRRFNDFDPSRIDIHEGKNRPWDYDHILPTATLYQNRGPYRDACKQWANTIGNFRAWALEENRSRHDDIANKAIFPQNFQESFILDQAECDAFSLTWDQVYEGPSKPAEFMNSARSRILRIYVDWFDSLDIGNLLGIDAVQHYYATESAASMD